MTTYGEMLRAKGIGFLSKGQTRDRIIQGRDAAGARTKTTVDQLGNEVTEHNNRKDQVDVKIKAPSLRIKTQETRDGA